MSRVNDIIESLEELTKLDKTFEMANLESSETGLPYRIWIDSNGSLRNVGHNLPSVKVEVLTGKKSKLIPIILYPEGAKLLKGKTIKKQKLVEKWVDDRKDIIIKHWNKELTDREALNMLVDFGK